MTDHDDLTRRYIVGLSKFMDKPARIPALAEVHERMTPEVFWPVFSHIWTGNESCFQHLHSIAKMITVERVLHPARLSVMTPEERFTYDNFAKRSKGLVKVYRGAAKQGNGDNLKGWSWTLSRDKAVFFATRYGAERPVLLAGRVKASDVLFYENGRNEQEVFVNPARVYVEDFAELPGGKPTMLDIIGKNSQVYGVIDPAISTPYAEELQRFRLLITSKFTTSEALLASLEDMTNMCRELGFIARTAELERMREELVTA